MLRSLLGQRIATATSDGVLPVAAQASCQQENGCEFSRLSCPHWLLLVRRLVWHLRFSGVGVAARKIWDGMAGRAFASRLTGTPSTRSNVAVEVLGLQAGDLVEVKSEDEILRTLDAKGKCRGLAFLPDMRAYCGRRLVVHKRLERIYLEESGQIRRMKNTVLLAGATCEGKGIRCDRSCYFYWREAWLRRAELDRCQ